MTAPVRHRDIREKKDLSEPRRGIIVSSVVVVAVRQPNCLFAAAQVETKITNSVIDSFPDDVSVIPGLLAYGGKDGEVGGELGM